MTEAEALEFVQSAELPLLPEGVEADMRVEAPAMAGGVRENLVVGSQLGIVDESVSGPLREHVAHTLLFAQLTADAQEQADPNSVVWFDAYVTALNRLGWRVNEDSMGETLYTTQIAQAHRAVTGVLVAALGPQAAVAATIKAVLDGLVDMAENSPWLTLYSRKSHRVRAKSFSVGAISGNDTEASMSMLHMSLMATMSVEQFLFFRSDETINEFAHRKVSMAGSAAVFALSADALRQRLAPYLGGYITDAPLPAPHPFG